MLFTSIVFPRITECGGVRDVESRAAVAVRESDGHGPGRGRENRPSGAEEEARSASAGSRHVQCGLYTHVNSS